MNFVPPLNRLQMLFVLGSLSILTAGCSKPANSTPKAISVAAKEDAAFSALDRLERTNDAATCRQVLLNLDSGIAVREAKPEPTVQQLRPLIDLLELEKDQVEVILQTVFTRADADYMADCFLLRDAMQALEIKQDAPLQQAERAFAWVCRQVYLRDTPYLPAPPWWVLQAGSGSSLDRVYVFLAALRQLGLDGCLVGPPELATSTSIATTKQPGAKPRFAPVRAVGVRIDTEIFLFDPVEGQPLYFDGKIATLAQLRNNPANTKASDVRSWEVFVSAPGRLYRRACNGLKKRCLPLMPCICTSIFRA